MNHEKAEANQQNFKKKGVVGCIESTINQLVSSQVDIEKAGTVELSLFVTLFKELQKKVFDYLWGHVM